VPEGAHTAKVELKVLDLTFSIALVKAQQEVVS